MDKRAANRTALLPVMALVAAIVCGGSVWRLWATRSSALVAETNWLACRALADQIASDTSPRDKTEPLDRVVEAAAVATKTEDHLSDVQLVERAETNSVQVRLRTVSLPQLFRLLRHAEAQGLSVQSVLIEDLQIESTPGWEAEVTLSRAPAG